jgi:putative protease
MGLFDFFKSIGKPKEAKEKLEEIGVITHYFPHVKAAVIKLSKGSIKIGDDIYIKGHTTDFRQAVKSLQLNRAPIQEGNKGQEVGLKVKSRVRIGDLIYKA